MRGRWKEKGTFFVYTRSMHCEVQSTSVRAADWKAFFSDEFAFLLGNRTDRKILVEIRAQAGSEERLFRSEETGLLLKKQSGSAIGSTAI